MLIGRMVAHGMRRCLPIVQQRLQVACPHLAEKPVQKFQRVRRGLTIGVVTLQLAQIMGETARTDQQHPGT